MNNTRNNLLKKPEYKYIPLPSPCQLLYPEATGDSTQKWKLHTNQFGNRT